MISDNVSELILCTLTIIISAKTNCYSAINMQMQYTVKHMEVNTVLGKEILTFTKEKLLRVKT